VEGVVDTNVLISCLIRDDINHRKAKEIIEGLEKWYLPTIVIHEFVWFLKSQKLKITLAIPFIEHSKSLIIPIEKEDILFALKNSVEKPSEYNDFLILSVALRMKKELITFDEELKNNFKKFLKTYK
jgi:hypothetical protein